MDKLIGKQSKLDRNKNGKLDKEDFKMLKSGKGKARKDEQFIDRVIGILIETRLEEISADKAALAATVARSRGKDAQARKLIQGAEKRAVAEKKAKVKPSGY